MTTEPTAAAAPSSTADDLVELLPHMSRREALLRAGVLVVLVVGGWAFVRWAGITDVDSLQATVRRAGAWGPVLFAVGYAVTSLLPVPRTPMSILAGLVFGFGTGVVAAYLGAAGGAALGFVVGRSLGRGAVEQLGGERTRAVERYLRHRGVRNIAMLRLVPIAPFTVINYTAGALAVPWRAFAIGSLFGMVPGTLIYAGVGAFAG